MDDSNDDTVAAIKAEHRIAYAMAEFEALKGEIAALVDQTTRNLNYAIAVSGGVLAWLLTHKVDPNLFRLARSIPFIVAALFALYSFACYARIGEKAAYIALIEKTLSLPGLGWETRFKGRKAWLGAVNFLIWMLLLTGTLLVAAYLPQGDPRTARTPVLTISL